MKEFLLILILFNLLYLNLHRKPKQIIPCKTDEYDLGKYEYMPLRNVYFDKTKVIPIIRDGYVEFMDVSQLEQEDK